MKLRTPGAHGISSEQTTQPPVPLSWRPYYSDGDFYGSDVTEYAEHVLERDKTVSPAQSPHCPSSLKLNWVKSRVFP